jgi:hypothetical protein
MEPVRGQDDRKRERHARDGVWLPAGGRRPGARGFPGSRHTPGPGIVKGEAFSPLTRRRSPQVGKTPLPTRRNRISAFAAISARAEARAVCQAEHWSANSSPSYTKPWKNPLPPAVPAQ